MAQQANPIGIGQRELLRIQFIAALSRVKTTLPSIFESYATGLVSLIPTNLFFLAQPARANFLRNPSTLPT
jgi:hypothetical protein